MNEKPKIDPLTKEEFFPKKSSQCFANPKNRIKYNNQRASKLRQARAFVDKPLHQNHLILKEILGSRSSKEVHEQFLLGKGFNFSIYSYIKKLENINCMGIYDMILCPLGNNKFEIKKI